MERKRTYFEGLRDAKFILETAKDKKEGLDRLQMRIEEIIFEGLEKNG